MYIGDIVRQYREENHISLRVFAERCVGITHGYLAALEAGKNPNTGKPSHPSIKKLTAIAHGMGITYEQLNDMMNDRPPRHQYAPEPAHLSPAVLQLIDNAIPVPPSQPMVPVIGTVRAGPGGLAFQELQGAELANVTNASEYFYLRVEGDSMVPAIEPGDLALVHIQPEVDNGQLAVVMVSGDACDEGTIKRFTRTGDTVILQSFNPAYAPRVFVGEEINALIIAGRVVETKKKW